MSNFKRSADPYGEASPSPQTGDRVLNNNHPSSALLPREMRSYLTGAQIAQTATTHQPRVTIMQNKPNFGKVNFVLTPSLEMTYATNALPASPKDEPNFKVEDPYRKAPWNRKPGAKTWR